VIVENLSECLELDELYWYISKKAKTETRENVYVITMVRRQPRQIVGVEVALDKTAERIQKLVDRGPEAAEYCTDGYHGYLDVVFPGRHKRNIHNKKDTFTVEGVNADLRHFIPLLRRRSRCFARSIETLTAVIDVFVDAYNRFGAAKFKYRQLYPDRYPPFGLVDFL
jgi:IS1 family transposase